ncbi:LamB/YcsF family protein [Natronococcus wangiae]|uniref:LamB/YcsF family protein n=1 Tax=Natronococcus wangiae TaxID=3068275 RepID=UPI00273DA0FE|nr:5-oxoprolinase subunit PxpA [Natronococcus sp. AD5]
MVAIDINCDMGESFGNYSMGRDVEVMPYITSANVAGGFHAGDPHVMRETVALAEEHGVGIGAHPGLPDMMGFGRRKMDATPREVRDYVVYQLGALTGFAERAGAEVQHVKPHGAMYSMLSESEDHARAVMEAILDVDPNLVYLATDMNIYEIAEEYDELDAVFEGYVDLDYRADRTLIVEKEMTATDPELAADRAVSIANRGEVESVDGTTIDVPADSLCIHGDSPNSVEVLETIHERFEEEGIELKRLDELVASSARS